MEISLEAVVDNQIWVCERNLWYHGVRLRSRSTIVRLSDGQLWIHSVPPPTEAFVSALAPLGDVRFLVVPNRLHHLGAPLAAETYPAATLVGPRSAVARNAALKLDAAFDSEDLTGLFGDLESIPLEGVPFLDEMLFFDRRSGTLIGCDFIMSACEKDHWTWRLAARVAGLYQRPAAPPELPWVTGKNEAAARSVERIVSLPIRRVLVAHTDPIVDTPRETIARAWSFVRPKH